MSLGRLPRDSLEGSKAVAKPNTYLDVLQPLNENEKLYDVEGREDYDKYRKERDALNAYINLRIVRDKDGRGISPYSKQYIKLIEEYPEAKPLFVMDLVRSKLWVNSYWKDLGYHLLQAHPIFGVFSHHLHPMKFCDRMLFFISGFAMGTCSAAYVTGCKELCDDTCVFANNDVCDDGVFFSDSFLNTSNCTWGTDCSDCGVREQTDVSTLFAWNSLMKPEEYILCVRPFPHPEAMFLPLAIAICIAVGLTVLKELSYCRCFANDESAIRKQCKLFARILMTGLIAALYALAIYAFIAFEVNWVSFAINKTLAYILSAGGAWFFFHFTIYPAERKGIEKEGLRRYHDNRLCTKSFKYKTKQTVRRMQKGAVELGKQVGDVSTTLATGAVTATLTLAEQTTKVTNVVAKHTVKATTKVTKHVAKAVKATADMTVSAAKATADLTVSAAKATADLTVNVANSAATVTVSAATNIGRQFTKSSESPASSPKNGP